MRRMRFGLTALAAVMLVTAACGGDDASSPSVPRLANSPIPTVTAGEGVTAVCSPVAAQPLPSDFPATEVVVPPDFAVWSVERAPHLRVVGTVNPPPDANGRAPWNVVGDALIANLQGAGWTVALNDKIEGRDYDFTAPDGRTGHFLAQPRSGCFPVVDLTYDINWITG